jgi:hypothetical protein
MERGRREGSVVGGRLYGLDERLLAQRDVGVFVSEEDLLDPTPSRLAFFGAGEEAGLWSEEDEPVGRAREGDGVEEEGEGKEAERSGHEQDREGAFDREGSG